MNQPIPALPIHCKKQCNRLLFFAPQSPTQGGEESDAMTKVPTDVKNKISNSNSVINNYLTLNAFSPTI